MSGEIQPASPDAARHLTDRIKTGVDLLWHLVAEAYMTRAWAALGYESWDDYCTREFGAARLQLPREKRDATVISLHNAGLSQRAIEAATGVNQSTVSRRLNSGDASPEENASPADRLGQDGKVYHLRPKPQPAEPERPPPAVLALPTHDGRHVPYVKPQTKATFNQTDGEGISWAAWSWNPVTGCLHGCPYCYARAIAHRWPDAYPAGFTPLFHHERLDAPANTVIPAAHRDDPAWRRVFVCSMADLYGRWVPGKWLAQVHAAMLANPQWQYILLTKFPARYTRLQLPPGAWIGTSVDEQKRVRIAENAFREISGAAVKWLSLEPLLEPLHFTDLSMFDWVVIGGQTETRQPDGIVPRRDPPSREYVMELTLQAKQAGCAVHWKPNIRQFMWFDEYPGAPHSAQAHQR